MNLSALASSLLLYSLTGSGVGEMLKILVRATQSFLASEQRRLDLLSLGDVAEGDDEAGDLAAGIESGRAVQHVEEGSVLADKTSSWFTSVRPLEST